MLVRTHQIRIFLHRTPWVALVLALLSACSPSQPSEQKKVSEAVKNLGNGTVSKEISSATTGPTGGTSAPSPEDSDRAPFTEGCLNVARPDASQASDAEKRAALEALVVCARELKAESDTYSQAIDFLKQFSLASSESGLAGLGATGIRQYLSDIREMAQDEAGHAALESRRRTIFTDDDLQDLVALARLRFEALSRTEGALALAMRRRADLIDWAATRSNRWRAMAAVRDTFGLDNGKILANRLAQILRTGGYDLPNLQQFAVQLLHPYTLDAAIPDDLSGGSDVLSPLNQTRENPFLVVREVVGNLGGFENDVRDTISRYQVLRQYDNPPIPEHARAARDAVRVAIMDTGVDYLQYPELGMFLGQGGESELSQRDFADNDLNSFMPANASWLNHGTGVLASFLSVFAHEAPAALAARKLDVAVWKVESIREMLSGPAGKAVSWNPTVAFDQAIIQGADTLGRKPQIVSVSLQLKLRESLARLGRVDAVLKAPWLWVMAAGNNALEVTQDHSAPSCLSEFAPDEKKRDFVLCVGALRRGIVRDRVANYSNFGPEVDVYTYDTYDKLCPSGTSCATPAMSAVAAIIAEAYPALTVPQIRLAILGASEMRELGVEPAVGTTEPVIFSELYGLVVKGAETRPVLVFDPATMLTRAMERAATLAAN